MAVAATTSPTSTTSLAEKRSSKRSNVEFAPEAGSPPSPSLLQKTLSEPPRRYMRTTNGAVKPVDSKRFSRSSTFNGDHVDERDPWSKSLILCLDGGGVKGLMSLFVLQALMDEVVKEEQRLDPSVTSSVAAAFFSSGQASNKNGKQDTDNTSGVALDEQFLPCHYFDFIAGTSTGGLIAILIGRLRLSVRQSIKSFQELVFNLKRPLPRVISRSRNWPTAKLGIELKKTMNSHDEGFLSSSQQCKTIVVSFQMTRGIGSPYVFRTYNPNTDSINPWMRCSDTTESFTVWQVARATSAAPVYFKHLETKSGSFSDAGIHDPTTEVINEVKSLEGCSKRLELLLSVGVNIKKSLVHRLTRTRSDSISSVDMNDLLEDKERSAYHRLAPEAPSHILNASLIPRKEFLSGLEKIAKSYCSMPEVSKALQSYAEILVRCRRERARTIRWEYFAEGTLYACPMKECPSPSKVQYEDRSKLLDHLMKVHEILPPDPTRRDEVEKLLNDGRISPSSSAGLRAH